MATQLIEKLVDLKHRDPVTESEAIEWLQDLIEESRGNEAQRVRTAG